MTILKNPQTGGWYTLFSKNGEHYYADLSDTPDRGPECMIFSCDEDGKVTDWNDVYSEVFDDMNIRHLSQCIRNFKSE